ncbi:protein of unknown function [Xenorhabdus nematophila AN6/1]|nr:protein of unknown function [Xenorhabdus nematophila AN6/1]
MRTCILWRNLRPEFGKWISVFQLNV